MVGIHSLNEQGASGSVGTGSGSGGRQERGKSFIAQGGGGAGGGLPSAVGASTGRVDNMLGDGNGSDGGCSYLSHRPKRVARL